MPCALGAGCACACGPSGWGRRWGFSNAFSWSPSGCGCASGGRAKRPFSFCWSAAGAAGMDVGPVLLLEGEDGRPTGELEAIYGDYRDNPEHQRR